MSKAQVKLALTATATDRVAADILERLEIPKDGIIRLPSVRKNLDLSIVELLKPNDGYEYRVAKVKEILNQFQSGDGSAIIYVRKQKLAIQLASDLVNLGFNAKPYHGGMASDERKRVEMWFLNHDNEKNPQEDDNNDNKEFPIVVGTIAFGMGVDCNNVRAIMHFDLPRSIEDYIQGILINGNNFCVSFR